MVNLITPASAQKLRSTYYLRLITAVCAALSVAVLISGLLLVPSYFFIHAEADQAADYVATAGAIADERAKGEAPDALATFAEVLKALKADNQPPLFAKAVSVLTADIPRGVSLNKVEVLITTNANVSLSGVAKTRAGLIAYADALRKVSGVSNVDVPVADLVADVDSNFTITATYTPAP